mgnify:CR=1 FL=1
MNIIVLHNNYTREALSNHEPSCYTLPETAVQKNGKPVFLPDYANPAGVELHLALRISRLGRHISPRFAHRYYDAVTAMPHFFAPELLEQATAQGLPWSLAMGFDTALPVGEFVPLPDQADKGIDFLLSLDGTPTIKGNSLQLLVDFDQAIARVSQFFTLRRGDWLLMGGPQTSLRIEPNHRIETFINEQCVSAFNVK